MERLQKILARGGVASRRAAEQLVLAGRVRVNGRVVTELGTRADPRRDRVEVDGKRVVAEQPVYVVLHKPRGVVSTMSDPEGRPTVRELLGGFGARVFPVGRLDFATSGIILATNDGELADALLHPRKAVPKTYIVKVRGVMEPRDLEIWRKGVRLEDGMTLPADVTLLRHEGDKTWIELTIREGRNQQIRRMGDATRFPVMRLARVSFAGIDLEGLPPGKARPMTRDELIALKKAYGVPRSISSGVRAPAPAKKPAKPTAPKAKAKAKRRSAAGSAPRSRTEGARYGGGSPGRRSADTTEDWGGGIRRGSSSMRHEGSSGDRDDRFSHGGRHGRSRTTGTGGGIGGSGSTDRVKGRRGSR